MRALDAQWLAWLRENLTRGCARGELEGVMRREGFDAAAISRAFDEAAQPLRTASPASTSAAKINVPNAKRFASDAIELYTAENFLDPGHCADLINLIKSRLRPSDLSTPPDSAPLRGYRTSRTCDLVGKEKAIAKLDAKICAALGVDPALAEPSQGQFYDASQEFKAHTDFFKDYEIEKYATPAWGQRTWTFMVYLNEPESGGETRFVEVDYTVKPKRGMALFWNNLLPNGEPNPMTIHQGMPVLSGTKHIITKWFRRPPGKKSTASKSGTYAWAQPMRSRYS